VVSHDRAFLNNVVTSTLAFECRGERGWEVNDYAGGYDDWMLRRKKLVIDVDDNAERVVTAKPKTKDTTKLSYNEKRELGTLPNKIDAVEKEMAELHRQLELPETFGNPALLKEISETLAMRDAEHSALLARWDELESKNGE